MSRHIRALLYEYAAGELTADEARSCEEHLAGCPSCRNDLRKIREALALVSPPGVPPSAERDEKF